MDGDGRQQDVGRAATPERDGPENAEEHADAPARPQGRGEDRHGGGALATDRSDKAVDNQSIVTADDYSGSSESGV